MMKKLYSILVSAFLCVGCTNAGSFEEGTINLAKLSKDIFSKIKDEQLNMGILQESSLDVNSLQEAYGINEDDVEAFVVYQGVIPADCVEIAIFHFLEEKKNIVEDGIAIRIKKMKEEQSLLPGQTAILDKSEVITLGEYMIFVSGVDAQKVIEYIRSR